MPLVGGPMFPMWFKLLFAAFIVFFLVYIIIGLVSPDNSKSPKCSIEKFYVPGLDKSLSTNETAAATLNTTISFDLSLKNENSKESGVYYETLNISLYYILKGSIGSDLHIPIGNVSIPGFHQKGNKVADHRLETVQTFGVPWKEARSEVSNGSSRTMFKVNLASKVMLEEVATNPESGTVTKIIRENLNLGVHISVNDQGMKMVPGSLRLSSASPYIQPCSILVLVLSVSCLI